MKRAREAGVTRLINPGTDLEQSRAAIAVAEQFQGVWAAVGVHPQDVGGLTNQTFDALAELARHPKVVAIGEVGLEVSSRAGTLEHQKEWLTRFLDLASACGKPLIFHVRSAHAEMRHLLTEYRNAVRGTVHCFSGTPDDATYYASRGLFLGITGIVTFPNAAELQTVVQDTPLDRLLLETDAPFLAPQSHRGKRNEPAYLVEVAEKVAELREVSVAEVERGTDENATRLFGL